MIEIESALPGCASSNVSRLKRTEAATPSASRACWEFCATAFSTVWMSKGTRSEAWARVSPKKQRRSDSTGLRIQLNSWICTFDT